MSDSNNQDRPLAPDEERLLDAALGLSPLGDQGALEARELVDLVARTRAGLTGAPVDPARVAALVSAARGEADRTRRSAGGSFWRHLRGGLRHDRLVQVAAASLLVHLAALPVLAWMHFSAPPERSLNIRFEQPSQPLTAEPEPELLEPVELPFADKELEGELDGALDETGR